MVRQRYVLRLTRFCNSGADGEGGHGGSRDGGGVEAAGIRRRNVLRLARCGEVEVELQPWNLTVRAVAPAGRGGEIGEAAGIRRRDFLARPDEDALVPFLEFRFQGLMRT